MSRQRNQNDGNLKDILRRLYRLERQSPLSHSAIGREGLEVYDGGWIRILNGGLQVIGTATISGTLDVTGTTNLSGVTNITGPLNVTGPTSLDGVTTINGDTTITGQLDVTGPTNLDGVLTINGDTTITGLLDVTGDTTISGQLDVTGPMSTKGTLSVEGVTTLSSDLDVVAGGKITAGTVVVDPTGGGRIYFADGEIRDDGGLGMFINNPSAVRISTSGTIQANAGTAVNVISGGPINLTAQKTWITGQLEVSSIARFQTSLFYFSTTLPTTANAPNLHIAGDGRVYRSTWTPA